LAANASLSPALRIPVSHFGISGFHRDSPGNQKTSLCLKYFHKNIRRVQYDIESYREESEKTGLGSEKHRIASTSLHMTSEGFRGPPLILSSALKAIVILVSGGRTRMEHKTLEEALKNAVQKLMETENSPGNTIHAATRKRFLRRSIGFRHFEKRDSGW
jgi:hypothetical protein